VHPDLALRLGTNASLWYAEFDVRDLIAGSRENAVFHDFSRFPLAHRDISLVGSRTVTFDQLQAVIEETGAPLLAQSELFDVYESGEEKSFALHLSFGAPDRTLGGQEMDQSFDAIVAAVGERLGMRLKA
jgi:phenylalanyl-tRNA synthetase beta chain